MGKHECEKCGMPATLWMQTIWQLRNIREGMDGVIEENDVINSRRYCDECVKTDQNSINADRSDMDIIYVKKTEIKS